jgi:hypothetical protein
MIMGKIELSTIRFNNETFSENCSYREKHKDVGCIYGCPLKIKEKIPLGTLILVVEMNNTKNQIEGIGLIRNIVRFDKSNYVYDWGNYNRYIYRSKYRLDREILSFYNPRIVEMFDDILFKGKSHLKRGQGITSITSKLLDKDICKCVGTEDEIKKEIIRIFKIINNETTDEINEPNEI